MSYPLIVIDAQEGFVTDQTRHAAERIRDILETELFDPVIFTKFRNTNESPYRDLIGWNKMSTDEECALWSGFGDLIPRRASLIVDKVGYNGIVSPLKEMLLEQLERSRGRGILTRPPVGVVGIDTDCCITQTAGPLFEMGFAPVVFADLCASNAGSLFHSQALDILERLIGKKQIIPGSTEAELRPVLEERFPNPDQWDAELWEVRLPPAPRS